MNNCPKCNIELTSTTYRDTGKFCMYLCKQCGFWTDYIFEGVIEKNEFSTHERRSRITS